nr:MAG TPA: hypothetical protein [Caudoviricetes sp.]
MIRVIPINQTWTNFTIGVNSALWRYTTRLYFSSSHEKRDQHDNSHYQNNIPDRSPAGPVHPRLEGRRRLHGRLRNAYAVVLPLVLPGRDRSPRRDALRLGRFLVAHHESRRGRNSC